VRSFLAIDNPISTGDILDLHSHFASMRSHEVHLLGLELGGRSHRHRRHGGVDFEAEDGRRRAQCSKYNAVTV